MLPRNSDIIHHVRLRAKATDSSRVYQAVGDQVVVEVGVANIYTSAEPPHGFSPVSVSPPNLRPRLLHGRSTELQEAGAENIQHLMGEITILHGMGGIGKTALALTVASAVRRNGVRVFWVQAAAADSIRSAMHQIAVQLGCLESQAHEARAGHLNVVDLAWEALHASEKPWLLVFDSADDPSKIEQELGAGWLEASDSGAVLITTRHGSADLWPPAAKTVKINPLTPTAGTEMLLDLSGIRDPQPADRDAANVLSQRLGGIPLALYLAGRTISHPASPLRSFKSFHEALDQDFGNVVDRATSTSIRPCTEADARELVMRTWEVSLDSLEQQGIPHVRSIMRVLSCWAARSVPTVLLSPKILGRTFGCEEAAWNDLTVERALGALHSVGLIDINDDRAATTPIEGNTFYHWASGGPKQRCVLVHPLVAEVNAANLDRSPERAKAWAAATRCLGALRGQWDTGGAARWQLAIPHLTSLADRLPASCIDLFETIVQIRGYLSRYLRMSGQYETGYTSALHLRARMDAFQPDEKVRFLIEYDCAEWAWHMSHLEEAHALATEACRLAENMGEPARFQALMARELAIAIHSELGFLESGEQMARALCRELVEDPEFLHLSLQAHHHLATILRESGRLAEAEENSRKAIRLAEESHIPPFTLAIIRHELGVILWHRGHLDQAIHLLSDVLRLQRSILPPWHPSVLVTRYDIASILGIQGKLMRALIDFMDIYLTEVDLLSKGHHNTLQTRHQVGQILVEMGELDQAEAILREVDEGYRAQGLQERSSDVLSTRHEIVHIKAQRGQHAEAHQDWLNILKVEQDRLGADHPSTLRTHYNWAISWATRGLPDVARSEMRKVLTARRRTLGPNHFETAQAARMLDDLARLDPNGWRFGGPGRRNLPRNRKERRRGGFS
ncbi:tetratricopeptide repeat protein [Kitasatospora sp. NPDC058162]|uniref:tetratricopeptide repeat protein n=1 Tax=Kitasatospora sp. NPDC058162 TaxID=3346362 RepID=UPI0036DAE80A